MRRIMRKPVYAICEQQRRRSDCTSAQSDKHLCCSLPRQYNTSSFYMHNLKPQPSFCSRAGRFVSYLDGNPEDRFSRDVAQIMPFRKVNCRCANYCSTSLPTHAHVSSLPTHAHVSNLSHVTRNPVFGVCDQVRLKPAYSATETSQSLESLDIETRGIILSKQRTTKVLIRLRSTFVVRIGLKQVFS